MSQENVERIQRALDAFARRDEVAWGELCDPDLKAVPVADWPEQKIQGREAVWNFLVASDEPWEPGPYEIGEVIDGADTAAVRLRRDLHGRSSGAEAEYDYWAVFTFRNGKVVRVAWFAARDQALEAAGLSE
jgi:ketosteroid isomerase-like protein